ncbi:MAG: hypothetical protein NWE78_06825 [Candidatus Bathyarchaeota archaeon]|nr:hypothetical protein [Candidatus Bathyarchaeota archaeon]
MNCRRIGRVQLLLSKRGTALPVSFLMLFVSLTIIVSATFYISVVEIQARGKLLNIAVAKQNMIALEKSIGAAKWSPDTSIVCSFEDAGGIFLTHPIDKKLLINVTDGQFQELVFNDNVGRAIYQLPSTETSISTLYMTGDRRAIINQTEFTMSQMYLSSGELTPEVTLTYRPLATISETGFRNGKPVNTLRIYVISLNQSTDIMAQGSFRVKATCTEVISQLHTYNLTNTATNISVKATFDGRSDLVILPVSSNTNGALVQVETLLCRIKLERIQGGN